MDLPLSAVPSSWPEALRRPEPTGANDASAPDGGGQGTGRGAGRGRRRSRISRQQQVR